MTRLTAEAGLLARPRAAGFRQRYGPWAVVTGASSGIGHACARQLAAKGINVVLAARRHDELASLAAQLRATWDVQTRVLAVDLARLEGPQGVADRTADLDIGLLAAAAGFGIAGPFLRASLAEQTDMLDVNCRAVLVLARLLGARMAATRTSGGIVLFGSLVGRQGAPGAAHYAATKAYVQALGEGLHVELAAHGIDVLAVTPGPVHTGFAERAGMRLGRAVTAEQVAAGSLRALHRGRMTTSPGGLSKLLGGSLAALPRPARTRIMSRVMTGLTVPAPEPEPPRQGESDHGIQPSRDAAAGTDHARG